MTPDPFSPFVTLPNHLTLVGTGNNVTASGEIAKRSIPIQLQPPNGEPEARTEFHHPDLPAYVRSVRPKVLGCLVGMVMNWLEAGQPKHRSTLGGFEAWSAAVGGILSLHGFTAWRTNERAWRRTADPEGEDLLALVDAWWTMHRHTLVSPAVLTALAEQRSLFAEVLTGKSERGKVQSFARRVLRAHEDRPVGKWIIRRRTSGNNPGYCLESPFSPGQVTEGGDNGTNGESRT